MLRSFLQHTKKKVFAEKSFPRRFLLGGGVDRRRGAAKPVRINRLGYQCDTEEEAVRQNWSGGGHAHAETYYPSAKGGQNRGPNFLDGRAAFQMSCATAKPGR